jgi:hypothetical protein
MKADAAFGPFLKFGEDVFCDEDDVRGTADEFGFGRVRLRNDESENSGAVGRRDGDESVAGLQLGVVGKVETELVDEEADAAVVVADKNVDALDAEVGRGLRGWSRGGHGEIIRGDAREEKDYAGALRSTAGRMTCALKSVYRDKGRSPAIIRSVSEFD